MSKFLIKLIDILLWPLGVLMSGRFAQIMTSLRWKMYVSVVRHRFKKSSNLNTFGIPFWVVGGKYIELGDNVILGKDCRLEATDEWRGEKFTPSMRLGNNVVVNPLCHIGCINEVVIGDYVSIGERTYITDHFHGASSYAHLQMPPRHRPLFSRGKVVIGECATIGENCAIMPGVTIGAHSVIGANSVVTKDVPPYSIVAGIPAKVLKIVEPE